MVNLNVKSYCNVDQDDLWDPSTAFISPANDFPGLTLSTIIAT